MKNLIKECADVLTLNITTLAISFTQVEMLLKIVLLILELNLKKRERAYTLKIKAEQKVLLNIKNLIIHKVNNIKKTLWKN